MKKLLFLSLICAVVVACGGNGSNTAENSNAQQEETPAESNENPSYDPHRGEGKFKDVEVSPTLDATMADNGSKVYDVKCSSCHKLTDEKLVGPGWKGVTERNSAAWIMNFVTNTAEMIDKDPKVQAQLEICLVRMPNQNLSDEEARSVYEFMRKNDGVK